MNSRLAPDLTIVSVVFGDPFFLQSNFDLTHRLNPNFDGRWIVVDNSPVSVFDVPAGLNVDVMQGVPPQDGRDRGSLHHAMALEKALETVDTRFVLFLDHDFYVLRANWIAEITDHVEAAGVAFFGSTWHPRWSFQYRGFPSIHCMLMDLRSVPRGAIDLKPLIAADWWWRMINRRKAPWGGRWPPALRDTLISQRLRDTGWQVYRRYRRDRAVRTEMLLPHYLPPETRRYRLERRFSALLPDSWLVYPRNESSFTRESFLKDLSPEAFAAGWEEFFWRGEPFGVHLRRVGRAKGTRKLTTDAGLLRALIERVGQGSP